MTLVHVFWDDGAVGTYVFDNMRAIDAFLNGINARNEDELTGGNVVCHADGRRPGRDQARDIARQLGSTRVVIRTVSYRGFP
jgi:hypothetical protein